MVQKTENETRIEGIARADRIYRLDPDGLCPNDGCAFTCQPACCPQLDCDTGSFACQLLRRRLYLLRPRELERLGLVRQEEVRRVEQLVERRPLFRWIVVCIQ